MYRSETINAFTEIFTLSSFKVFNNYSRSAVVIDSFLFRNMSYMIDYLDNFQPTYFFFFYSLGMYSVILVYCFVSTF